jgi:hypothetical protein
MLTMWKSHNHQQEEIPDLTHSWNVVGGSIARVDEQSYCGAVAYPDQSSEWPETWGRWLSTNRRIQQLGGVKRRSLQIFYYTECSMRNVQSGARVFQRRRAGLSVAHLDHTFRFRRLKFRFPWLHWAPGLYLIFSLPLRPFVERRFSRVCTWHDHILQNPLRYSLLSMDMNQGKMCLCTVSHLSEF